MPEIKVVARYDGKSVDAGLKKLYDEILKADAAAKKLDASLAAGAGVKKASKDFTGLSRVIQDLPFGFIGIQNNITQLLPAAGALGLGLSAIVSAVTFAQVGFSNWTRGLKSNKAAVDELAKAYDGIISSLAEEQIKVDKIVVALENEKLSRKQRQEAIEQLQKIAPAYFGTLDKENATIAEITLAYNKFTQSIIRSIEARVREKELIGITEKILKLRDRATKIGTEEVMINGKLVKVSQQNYDLNSNTLTAQEAYNATLRGTIGLSADENKELTQLEATRARLLALIVESSGVDPFVKLDKEKLEKDKRTIQDVLAELKREIDFLSIKGGIFNTNEEKAKIQAIKGAINTLIKSFKVEPDDTIISKLLGDIELLENRIKPQEIQKAITNATKVLGDRGITIPVTPILNTDAISVFLVDATDQITAAMDSLFEGIATSIGETLGAALSGSASIGDFFKGIFNQLGQSMVELGKFFIQTGIQIKLIKDFLIKNPALAITGGIALVAIGSLLKNASNKQGFATGGVGFGTMLVGERGPEIISAPNGARITPNAQTNALLGAGRNGGQYTLRIAGRDLVAVLDQNIEYLGRNGQR